LKIAILTSLDQWFIPYAEQLNREVPNSKLYFDHIELTETFDIVFILSYHKIIETKYLKKNKHNVVIHASALPQGKGWAPMFWQVLEGKKSIPFSMFEASDGIDNGDIYMSDELELSGYELNEELRQKQAAIIIKMCLNFLQDYDTYKTPKKQTGKETTYPKRSPSESELAIDKTIKEQFNLLRICSNEEYPAFFKIDGHAYVLKISKREVDE